MAALAKINKITHPTIGLVSVYMVYCPDEGVAVPALLHQGQISAWLELHPTLLTEVIGPHPNLGLNQPPFP